MRRGGLDLVGDEEGGEEVTMQTRAMGLRWSPGGRGCGDVRQVGVRVARDGRGGAHLLHWRRIRAVRSGHVEGRSGILRG